MHLTTGHPELYVVKDEDISFDEIQTPNTNKNT